MKLPMGNDVTIMLDPNSSSPNNMRIATVKNIEARSNNKESDAEAETKKKLDGIKMQQETFSQKLIREYLPTLNKEISSTIALLKKACSANIIPLQFRNIEGVYYLYDYLSTSNQSLSEALMQANLEAIKSKLDTRHKQYPMLLDDNPEMGFNIEKYVSDQKAMRLRLSRQEKFTEFGVDMTDAGQEVTTVSATETETADTQNSEETDEKEIYVGF